MTVWVGSNVRLWVLRIIKYIVLLWCFHTVSFIVYIITSFLLGCCFIAGCGSHPLFFFIIEVTIGLALHLRTQLRLPEARPLYYTVRGTLTERCMYVCKVQRLPTDQKSTVHAHPTSLKGSGRWSCNLDKSCAHSFWMLVINNKQCPWGVRQCAGFSEVWMCHSKVSTQFCVGLCLWMRFYVLYSAVLRCVRERESHLDCKATFAAADCFLVCLPLVRPTRLRDVDVFLPAEALP